MGFGQPRVRGAHALEQPVRVGAHARLHLRCRSIDPETLKTLILTAGSTRARRDPQSRASAFQGRAECDHQAAHLGGVGQPGALMVAA